MQIIFSSPTAKLEALRCNSYFSGLSENVLSQLIKGTSLRIYSAGEIICWQGDEAAGLHIIRQGSVKLFKLSLKGRELIIRIFGEGETFNEVPVFDHGPNPVNVAAQDDCEIWLIDKCVIYQAMEENPEMAQKVILNLSQNLRILVNKIEELSFYQVTNRLARLIGQLPNEQLEGQAAQRLTQDQLAARLGTVREVVARSLRELERSGAIRVNRRQIQVLNARLLEDWAQGPLN